jgi:predicted nucleic acid-binding protein
LIAAFPHEPYGATTENRAGGRCCDHCEGLQTRSNPGGGGFWIATALTRLAMTKGACAPRLVHRQTVPYQRLQERIADFAAWSVLSWTREAADILMRLRASGVRIGGMDLKIASIALSHRALLLTRNLRHFEKVPGLHAEDWLSA